MASRPALPCLKGCCPLMGIYPPDTIYKQTKTTCKSLAAAKGRHHTVTVIRIRNAMADVQAWSFRKLYFHVNLKGLLFLVFHIMAFHIMSCVSESCEAKYIANISVIPVTFL